MKYNFDELTDRRDADSYKWGAKSEADVIPLWVADMDFRTAPEVRQAVERRASTGIFGYTEVPDSYFAALELWFSSRHGWDIDGRNVIYTSGVVPAISAIIKALVAPGEKVALQTPAYNCFFSSIRNNKAIVAENPLRRIEPEADGFSYEIDFESLRELLADPGVKLLILCNPHNPTGRVWKRQELERLRDLCRDAGVRVVSDEIHCELTHPGFGYTPYATIDPEAIVCCSPSKAFNIAGLQIANIVCPDQKTRSLVDRAINDNEVCDVNPFGVAALEAAYTRGGEWLDALNQYLEGNRLMLREFFASRMPKVSLCDSESTYLAWIDISGLMKSSEEVCRELLDKAKVRVSAGDTYGAPGYIRINYACPRARLREALERMAAAI